MVSTRILAYTAGLIAIIVWRSGRVAKNNILTKHNFPTGYYAEGNYTNDCTTLKAPELKYCEDATFWNLLDNSGKFVDRGLLISCDAGRKSWNTVMGPLRDPEPLGSLWLYEPGRKLQAGQSPPLERFKRLELKGYPAGHDFHPLGVEIYPSYAGAPSNLYVINHARERTVIEHFILSPSAPTIATHVRTITSPYFVSPNSLALTSPDSFYVTNDHLLTRRLPYVGNVLAVIESIFALPLGFVSHVTLNPYSTDTSDAPAPIIKEHTFAVLFVPFPNGIAISPSGTHLALSSTTLGHVSIYARDKATHAIAGLIQSIPVPFTPDNLHYTHDGESLIVSGHPNFPALTAVAANKTGAAAPSWVLSIAMQGIELKEDFDVKAPVSARGLVPAVHSREVTTLFQSDGSAAGFSSSATGLKDPITGNLYVSGLYAEDGLLVCRPSS
ncbi:arylesterase [Collybia nuda]|uniref:Arylesterase n=1 Tax=Collybia nuda TaxID=64659 RepID=A0A9P5YFT5_9AGAR|nr:arylesterase [Collybia nuda]